MLDECPRCGCDNLQYHRVKGVREVGPEQRCECDAHPDCGWDERQPQPADREDQPA